MNKPNSRRVPPNKFSTNPGRARVESKKPQVEELQLVLRLLVGGALEGTEELVRRLKAVQAELQSEVVTTTVDPNETDLDRLRHALIGLLIQAPELMQQGMSSAGQVSNRAANFLSKVVRPVASSRLMRPVRRRYETLAARGEARLEHLLAVGRTEEQTGRTLARRTTTRAIDELIDFLAQKPELRELVQQQSMGMVDEMVGELRTQTTSADALVERVARSLLGRSPRESLPSPAGSPPNQPEAK